MLQKVKAFLFDEQLHHVSDGSLLRKYGRDSAYTPDWPELEKKMRVLVFVYDDFKKGGKLNEYLTETNLKGRFPCYESCYTDEVFYHWKRDLGKASDSVALRDMITGHVYDKDSIVPARIAGEMYAVRPETIKKLDTLRENGLQFFRQRVKILIPHDKVIYSKEQPLPLIVSPPRQWLWCQMYIGNGFYWDQQLGGVLPSRHLPYLKHTREEIGVFTKFDK